MYWGRCWRQRGWRYWRQHQTSLAVWDCCGLANDRWDAVVPIGLFIVSLFKGTLNGWLTTSYQATDPIPEDKRLWVKYTLQNIGSILTQFLLMVLASVIILKDGHAIQDFFIMTTTSTPTAESIQVMHGWNINCLR